MVSLSFNISYGSINYLYISETSNDVGMAVGTGSLWLWTMITSFVSPYMFDSSLDIMGTLWVYAGLTLVGLFYVIFVIKETKGLTDD